MQKGTSKSGKKKITADELKNMGNNAFRAGKFVDAVTLYSGGIRLEPNNHILFSNRAMAYFEQRKLDLSLKDANRCVVLRPDWPKGYLRQAKALRALGWFFKAKKAYEKGLTVLGKKADVERIFRERLSEVNTLLTTFPEGTGMSAVLALEELGMRQYTKQMFDSAIQKLEAVYALKKDMLEKESKELDLTINKVAGVYKAKAKYLISNSNSSHAFPFYERAAVLLRSRYGDGPATAAIHNEMAMILKEQGKFDDALEILKRILSIFEKSSDRVNMAETMVNIGNILEVQKKYKESLGYYQRGLKEIQTTKGTEHTDVATTLINMGIVLRKGNNMTEAKKIFSQALPILETNFGADSKEYADDLVLLGKTEIGCKAFSNAIDYLTRALKIQQRVLGDHEKTAVSLDQIGIAYSQIQKTAVSLKYFQQSLKMRQKVSGTSHPETGAAAMKVGATLIALQQWSLATKHLQEACKILTSTRGASHPQTKIALQNLELAKQKMISK